MAKKTPLKQFKTLRDEPVMTLSYYADQIHICKHVPGKQLKETVAVTKDKSLAYAILGLYSNWTPVHVYVDDGVVKLNIGNQIFSLHESYDSENPSRAEFFKTMLEIALARVGIRNSGTPEGVREKNKREKAPRVTSSNKPKQLPGKRKNSRRITSR